MAIIDLQKRMVEVGRIRAGDKGAKGEPRKLDKWRLTSKDRQRLEEAAKLWGGEVRAWEGRDEWELYTDTSELPIMLLPETEPSLFYELWTRGGCQRRCDGVSEVLSDGPCLCDPDERECKPHLRFGVLLPDLKGIGSWLVQSTGWNAANEIPGTVRLLSRASAQGVLLPARLRLEQRVETKAGKTRRYAVPVVDLDVSFRELLGQSALPNPSGRRELPSGYVPLAGNGGNGPSLAEGLATAERQTVARTARSSAAIPAQDDLDFGPAPTPADDSGALATPPPTEAHPSGGTQGGAPAALKPTKRQLDKLNLLVGRLREGGHISTEHLWAALATARERDAEFLILGLSGRDDEGELHWSPLRDDLNREEASSLIDRLERLEANVGATA